MRVMLLLVGMLAGCAASPSRAQPVQRAEAEPEPKAKPKPRTLEELPEKQPREERVDPSPELANEAQASTDPELNPEQSEGIEGGVEGGEIDHLRMRASVMYQRRLVAWFTAKFTPPGRIPCPQLKQLSAEVSADFDENQTLTSYKLQRSSGNQLFDAEVQAALSQLLGRERPSPPPAYPGIGHRHLTVRFTGRSAKC